MAVIAVLAICILPNLKMGGGKEQIVFETTKVYYGDVASSVTATGTVEPVTEVEVGTQVSGIIDKIYVDYNSEVKKGDVIAEMDMVTLLSDLKSAQASYDSAEAEYNYQEKTYNRNKTLYEKGHISEEDFDEYEYNYLRAKSSLTSAKAELERSQRELSYATITAPIDGIVIEKAVEEGQTVAAGFETPTLFYIAADMTKMQVVADVDEADIGGVEVGQRCVFTVDAYPDDTFEGRVQQIRLGSSLEDASTTTVITYEVVIYADNPELKLIPRLTANIEIYVIDRIDVLCVPARALRFNLDKELVGSSATVNDSDAENKVWTVDGDVYTAHPVEVGISNGSTTEILSGLTEGMEVLTSISVVSTKEAKAKKSSDEYSSPFAPSRRDRDDGSTQEGEEE